MAHAHFQFRETEAQKRYVVCFLPAGRGRAGIPTQVYLGASGSKVTRLCLSMLPLDRQTSPLDRGLGGGQWGYRHFSQLQKLGPLPGFSLEKASRPSEGLSAVPSFQRERASLPLQGVGRAGSNFPTMCKLVNLRVCKRGPLKGP